MSFYLNYNLNMPITRIVSQHSISLFNKFQFDNLLKSKALQSVGTYRELISVLIWIEI